MTYFDPKTVKYPYPLDTATHYLEVKKDDKTVFDKDYPYVDTSKKFKRKRFWFNIVLRTVAFLITRIRLGLKVEGRKNLKANKEVIKNGLITVCNHVHMWDFLGILASIKPYHPYHLSWDKNVRGENGKLIRLIGGIPIPVNDLRGSYAFTKQVKEMIESGGLLHLYPEGSMWEYYAKIRPFKEGAFFFAYKTGRPVLPLAYSYRKPGFIRAKIFKQIATFTLHIGTPIYPNMDLPKDEAIKDLAIRVHEAMVELAQIEDNLYPALYDNSQRIDYYTSEYGIGYKGSW